MTNTRCFQPKQIWLCHSFLFWIFSHFIPKNILIPLLIDLHQGQKNKFWTKWSWWAGDQLVVCSSKRLSLNIINLNSKQSTALAKDSTLSVNIIQQFVFCASFLFHRFLYVSFQFPFDFHLDIVGLSGVEFTSTKFLFLFWWNRNKDPSGRFPPIYYYHI